MNFTLHQLKVFVKVFELNSITRAAEELNLSQPAVSIQIKNFQEQFQFPLTELSGRKLVITEFGKEIAEVAKSILTQSEIMHYKSLTQKNELRGKLKISVVSTGKYIMPYFLTDFLKQNPGVELKMDVTNKAQVIQSLEENIVDFSLVSVLPKLIPIESIELLENQLYLVAGKQLNLRKMVYQDFTLLPDLPFIFRESGSATRQAMESFVFKYLPFLSKTIELTSNEAVKQAVMAGLGYSVMPLIGLRHELRAGEIQIIKFKETPIITKWQLVWHKQKQHSQVAQSFLDFINQNKQGIIEANFGHMNELVS